MDNSVWKREIGAFLADFEFELDQLMTELKVAGYPVGKERPVEQTLFPGGGPIGESHDGQEPRDGRQPLLDA